MSSHLTPRFDRLVRLCQKELKETLRDRRTIVTLLLMPVLVYPILSMALNRFLLSAGTVSEGFTVSVGTIAERDQLDVWLSDKRSYPPEAILKASGNEVANFKVSVIDDATPAILGNGSSASTVALANIRGTAEKNMHTFTQIQ